MAFFEWHFHAQSMHVTPRQFKTSAPDTCYSSDIFGGDGYVFHIDITPNGYRKSKSPLTQCTFWLMIDELPDGVNTLRAKIRFLCEEINYDISKTVLDKKSNAGFTVLNRADLEVFDHLNSWTLKCFITIFPSFPPSDKKQCLQLGQLTVDGIGDMLNIVRYNKMVKWLLEIWQNVMKHPDDELYRVIHRKDIKQKLHKQKYVRMFEAILMWSGFDRDANNDYDRWIYHDRLQNRTIIIAALWSSFMSKWKESKIKQLVDDGIPVEEAQFAIDASMIDSDDEEDEKKDDLMNALIEELVCDGYTIEEATFAITASYEPDGDDDEDDEKRDEYKAWFNDILQLPQYYERFIENNYKHLSYLDEDIDEDELMNDLQITNKSHRMKILSKIKELVERRKLLFNSEIDKLPYKAEVKIDDELFYFLTSTKCE